jgi:hypothetical protein
MTERKNIDRLFQEKFRDFEAIPDEKVWDNIEAELKKKKKRRAIPLWFKLSGVAALLVIGLIIFEKVALHDKNPENRIVIEQNTPKQNGSSGNNSGKSENKIEDATIPENPHLQVDGAQESFTDNDNSVNPSRSVIQSGTKIAVSNESPSRSSGQENTSNRTRPTQKKNVLRNISAQNAIADSPSEKQKSKSRENNIQIKQTTNSTDKTLASNPDVDKKSTQDQKSTQDNESTQPIENKVIDTDKILKDLQGDKLQKETIGIAENAETKKDTAAIATVAPNALEELLNEKENKVTAKEQKVNRWQITSSVAPIYFSSTSNGSPLDSRFEDNKKNYTPSFSYGVGAKYALNKKFSVKAGVNSVAMEYNTTDVVFFQTENARRMENVKPNMPGSLIQVDNKPTGQETTTLGRTITQYNGDLNQKIGYVEVPVEMSYKLIDRKFGVEVIGGLSTMILNQNEVSIVSSGMNLNIGEAENLNPVHFSTNVGVGFKYSFLKSFQANVEPMFKYQINTFSNDSGNFKPFFFGLYTGISYHF